MESMNAIDLQERCIFQTEQLQKTILAIYDPGEEAMAAFLSVWQEALPNGSDSHAGGRRERTFTLLQKAFSGCIIMMSRTARLRSYSPTPPSFGGVADSFLPKPLPASLLKPSQPTLSQNRFSATGRTDEKYHSLEHLIRAHSLNFAFAGVLERMVEIQCFTAEEKFRPAETQSISLT